MSDRLDELCHWVARHLPGRVVYWCAVIVGAHATTGKYSHVNVPSLLFMDSLKRWESPNTPEGEPCQHNSLTDECAHRRCDDCGDTFGMAPNRRLGETL